MLGVNPRSFWITLTDVALFLLLALNLAAVMYLLVVWGPSQKGFDASQEETLITR